MNFFSISFLFFILVTSAMAQDTKKISLDDLGFNKDDVKIDIKLDAVLKKRENMLQWHQRLGLLTAGLMTAAMLTGPNDSYNDGHKWLGISSGVAYLSTAYFALFSPDTPKGIIQSGSTKWHQRLAWVHFPLMITGSILGYLNYQKREKNERPSGLIKNHNTIIKAAYFPFMLSATLMYIEF